MKTVLLFILVFGILVIIHEYGHYIVAKKSGILVREFAIGFGPKIFSFRKDETTYTIRLLPLGGYVRMAGAEEETELRPGMPLNLVLDEKNEVRQIDLSSKKQSIHSIPFELISADLEKDLTIEGNINGEPEQRRRYQIDRCAIIVEEDGTEVQVAPIDRQFQSAPLLNRILTNFAGPLNNFLLAILTFTFIAFIQGGVISSKPILGKVLPDSPAYEAGLKAGDEVVAVEGQKPASWMDFVMDIQKRPGEKTTLTVKNETGKKTIELIPEKFQVETGDEIGRIGVEASIETGLGAKLTYGFTQSLEIISQITKSLVSMFTGGFSIDMFGGPVAIFATTEAVAQTGMTGILNWLAVLSLNLFILNLLPIPALDGGKILLNLIEAIRGKPLSEEKEGIITLIGVALMVLLMIAVTWNDIQKFFLR